MPVGYADIMRLVEARVPEGATLDFKRELPGKSDSDKKDFVRDVAAFANTRGGRLYFGIEEEDGCASKIVGVACNPDAELLRLTDIARSGIQPPPAISSYQVQVDGGLWVLVLDIAKGFTPPYLTVFANERRIWGRSTRGNYMLAPSEIRSLIIESSALSEKLEELRRKSVELHASHLAHREGRIPARVICQSASLDAMSDLAAVPPSRVTNSLHRYLPPDSSGGANYMHNLEGVSIFPTGGGVPTWNVQANRNASLEYWANVPSSRYTHDSRPTIDVLRCDTLLTRWTERVRKLHLELGLSGPVAITWSVVCLPQTIVLGEHGSGTGQRDSRSAFMLPLLVIEDPSGELMPVLAPLRDILWNSFGFEAAPPKVATEP